MHETPTVVAVAVVQHDGKFLVGVRSADGPLPGFAEFPGGKVNADELPTEAAVRECLEESGLDVEVVRDLYVAQQRYDYGLLEIYFYLCRLTSNSTTVPAPPFRWVDTNALQTLNFPAANVAVTRILLTEIEADCSTPRR